MQWKVKQMVFVEKICAFSYDISALIKEIQKCPFFHEIAQALKLFPWNQIITSRNTVFSSNHLC